MFLTFIVLLIAALWYFIPLVSGLPWIPSKVKRIYHALELAALKPGEVLYDLGAGDGRVLMIAARDFGARAIGIEIGPVHCIIAWLRILLAGVRGSARIKWGNLYRSEFGDADVIYAYLTQGHALRIKPLLEAKLQVGARVVTISSDLDGWEPTNMDSEHLIFLYKMPPVPGSIASFMRREAGLKAVDGSGSSEENES